MLVLILFCESNSEKLEVVFYLLVFVFVFVFFYFQQTASMNECFLKHPV